EQGAHQLEYWRERRRLAEDMRSGLEDIDLALSAPFAELVSQPALADAGRRHDADDAAGVPLGVEQGLLQDVEFGGPPAHRRAAVVAEPLAFPARLQPDETKHLDRCGDTLERTPPCRLGVAIGGGQLAASGAQENGSRLRRLFQAAPDVQRDALRFQLGLV